MTKIVRVVEGPPPLPHPSYDGWIGQVKFTNGVAEVADDAPQLDYFRAAGYAIEDPDERRASARQSPGSTH